ncbi:MAG: SDR family NAD(P)-dependent oxidoreductase [Actinobacteria bacterium]|nr:SDR family NAD(P)-dependent oxidoreductase [Actinomycetota bacterium]
MADGRSVVVTGASRGLGLATSAHLYRQGWTVLAAMRSPEEGMDRLRAVTGAPDGDPRLVAVRLDVDSAASVTAAATAIQHAVGPPHGIVHNAGVAGVGTLEEMPHETWEQIFSTNFFGPVRLTRELLPSMRAAGRGRIVVVSSQGAIRGMPGIGAYSASKGALERWAESLSQEIAAFGLGVTVLVAGSFKTDILELTKTYADPEGPYAGHHAKIERNGRRFIRFASAPERFAPAVARALDERRPFARHGVGIDARLLMLGGRMLPGAVLQGIVGRALGLPRPGSLRPASPPPAASSPEPSSTPREG